MDNVNNSLGRWISLLHRYSHIYIGRQLEGHEVSKGQYVFLNALYKKDGISQEELSEYLKIDKGTTAKMLKELEEFGYVVRQTSESDKRSKKVFLTEKAIEIKPVIRKALESWTNSLWDGFTDEEKALTLKMIERIANNAIKAIEISEANK